MSDPFIQKYKGKSIGDIVSSTTVLTDLEKVNCFDSDMPKINEFLKAYFIYQQMKNGASPASNFTTVIQQTTEDVDDKEVDYGPAAGKMWTITQLGVNNDGGGVAQDFKLYNGSTEVPIIEPDTPAAGVYTYLTEEASVILPITISNGTYIRFYANLAAGKKMVTRIVYNEFSIY